jgi:hypothetical protein
MRFTGPSTPPGGGALPGVTAPLASFAVGDGGQGVPVNGQTQLRVTLLKGQNIVNKQLLVIREGVELVYADAPGFPHQISRYNDGVLGGFDFNILTGPGQFVQDDRYDIYIIGVNNTIEP